MTHEVNLRQAFVALEVNADFSEAVLTMQDGSRLRFCHRVGERWVRVEHTDEAPRTTASAHPILATIQMFRLNGKHLDILFVDGSRWEASFHG